jgi:hypothetical protein
MKRWRDRPHASCLLAVGLLALAAGGGARGQTGAAVRAATGATAEAATTTNGTDDLLAAWQTTDPTATPVENLALPIDYRPDGRVKALLRAGSALVPPRGYIRARDVTVEMYAADGKLDGVLTAENCIYDRKGQRGYCEGKVRIERAGVTVRGMNLVWLVKEQNAKILSQAEVRVDRFMRDLGGFLK